jgi:hypothetical protein
MGRYRSKPVTIDATLFDGHIVGEPDGEGGVLPGTCPLWLPGVVPATGLGSSVDAGKVAIAGDELLIGTLEGTMRASPGDWIIRGTHGELYPCKPNVFAVKYQPV